jgi:hypothetical protein
VRSNKVSREGSVRLGCYVLFYKSCVHVIAECN